MAQKKRLGEMLIEAGIIDETQLKAALGHQRQWGVRIGQALVDLKLVTEADIVRVLAAKYGFEIAHLDAVDPGTLQEALKLLPRDFAVRNNVLPIAADTASVTVVMSDPSNLAIMDEVQFRTGKRVKVCIGGDHEVADAVNRYYPGEAPVEAIALDLDAEDPGGEAVFDPFGGGSKDALEAFFGGGPEAHAHDAPPARPAAAPPAAPAAKAAPAAAAPASHPPVPATHAAAHLPPAAATSTRSTLPAQPAVRTAPPAQPKPSPSAPASRVPPPSPPAAHAPAPKPARAAEQARAPAAAPPAARPAAQARPVPAAPAPRGPDLALDLEEGPRARPRDTRPLPAVSPPAGVPSQQPEAQRPAVPQPAAKAEPALAADLAPEEQVEGRATSRELTEKEIAILDALERLAGGAHAEPEIVKPTQAMAAVIRLLLRKRVFSEPEFLDELTKK